MNNIPFEIITGPGLGSSYSSLKQIGSLWAAEPFGQMQMSLHYNISNKNLLITDRAVISNEYNFPQEIRLIYNSGAASADQAWRFSVKKISKFPSGSDNSLTLIQEDGHATPFTYNSDNDCYFAPKFLSGTPYITQDSANNRWVVFYQDTQVTEYYDNSGNLQQRVDDAGRITNYEYTNNVLSAVTGPSGDRYEIRSSGNSYAIFLGSGAQALQLQVSTLEASGLTTTLPDGSFIKYSYTTDGTDFDFTQISTIEQSGGTLMSLDFDTINNESTLTSVRTGGTAGVVHTFRLDYSVDSQVCVNGSEGSDIYFDLDEQQRIKKVSLENGFIPSDDMDATGYGYDADDRLITITHPDSGVETFSFNFPEGSVEELFGLLQSHTEPNGRVNSSYYDTTQAMRIPLISTSVKTNATANDEAVTRRVYDYDFDSLGQYHRFLRFEVSQMGRVTEYLPLRAGTIGIRKVYNNVLFTDAAGMPPDAILTLANVKEWVSKQDPQAVCLSAYTYDSRGQVLTTLQFANVDAQGNGIKDEEMSSTTTTWDEQGGLLQIYFKQLPGQVKDFPLTSFDFDVQHRPTNNTDALGQQTGIAYNDSALSITKTLPNGRNDVEIRNSQGLVIQKNSIVGDETRTTLYTRDSNGIIKRIDYFDGTTQYPFYDLQNRLGYTVSTTGSVVKIDYNTKNRYKLTTTFENAVDIASIIPPSGKYPSLPALDKILQGANYSEQYRRCNYEFYDFNGRVQYKVDANNYPIQYVYDEYDNVVNEIAYATALTADQLNALLNGQTIALPLDLYNDRLTQKYYDQDNRLIGNKDPAGYVTEKVLDEAGRTIETIQYATPKPGLDAINDFVHARPQKDAINDAHSYAFYNSRNLLTYAVNAEGYLTLNQYLPCGLLFKTTAFANPVDMRFLQNPGQAPALPRPSTEDRSIITTYDALNRPATLAYSNGKMIEIEYDVMGHQVRRCSYDINNPNSASGDNRRLEEKIYDGFEDVVTEVNPFVAQQISAIELSSLPPDKKAAEINALWLSSSDRHYYNAEGLRVKTCNSLGNNTFYYYDMERRPCLEVGPTGIVKQRIYNATGEVALTRIYQKQIATTDLQGGLLTPAIQAMLDGISNPSLDQTVKKTYDHCGELATQTDAENNLTTLLRNAFRKVITKIIALTANQTLTYVYRFDVRGNNYSTTIYGGTFKKYIFKEFDNMFSALSRIVNAVNQVFVSKYDRVGNRISKTQLAQNPDEADFENIYTFDAFKRLSTETNSLKLVTTRSYNQVQRTVTTVLPQADTGNTVTNNVFEQAVARADSLGNSKKWTHAADGQIESATDELNRSTINEFDTNGNLTAITDPKHITTERRYNPADQLTGMVTDADGLDLESGMQPDAFGNVVSTTDPRQIITTARYDRLNNNTGTVVDPSGLNLQSTSSFNALSIKVDEVKGDGTVLNQWHKSTQVDALGRVVGTTVDPEGLNIQNSNVLDLADRVIKKTNGNGNATFYFFDSMGNDRFQVDASGAVTENKFNAQKQLIQTCVYAARIAVAAIDENTTIAQLTALLHPDNVADTQTYFYNDLNGKERFKLDILGAIDASKNMAIVEEHQYTSTANDFATIYYAKPISAATIASFTTATLAALMQENSNDPANRKTFSIYDAANQERFIIDSIGVVIEKRYDPCGKVIATITYANPVANPAEIAQLPVDKVLENITLDPVNDRYQYTFRDVVGRPQFEVDAEGSVVKYVYDKNSNVLSKCAFNLKVPMPGDYAAIGTLIASWKPDINNKDRITVTEYDPANRPVKKTDSSGNYFDLYGYDALNNETSHTDRANNVWIKIFDRANRPTKKISPTRVVTTTAASSNLDRVNAANYTGRLTPESRPMRFVEHAVAPNGDCGFIALGTDRNELTSVLATLINDVDSRKILGEEILNALMSQDDSLPVTDRWQTLITAYYKESAQQDELVRQIRSDFAISVPDQTPEALATWLEQNNHSEAAVILKKQISHVAKCYRSMETYVASPQMFVNYLQALRGSLFLGYQAAQLYAKVRGITLSIWQVDASTRKLSLAARSEAQPDNASGQVIHMLHTGGFTHYNLLEEVEGLVPSQEAISVEEDTAYDKESNVISVTTAANTSDKRSMSLNFNNINKESGKVIPNISIDDPLQPASFSVWPEQTVTLNTSVIYNTRGLKIGEQLLNQQWVFYLRDSLGRIIYELHPVSGPQTACVYRVKTMQYNAFDEVISSLISANAITLDITNYLVTGVPLDAITLVPSTADRRVTYVRDNNGAVLLESTDAVFFCHIDTGGSLVFNTAPRQTKKAYSTFGELVYQGSSRAPGVWAEKFSWHDRTGYVVAESTPEQAINLYTLNSFHETEKKIELSAKIATPLIQGMTLAELLAKIVRNPDKDRIFKSEYDTRGLEITTTRVGVVRSELQPYTPNVPPQPVELAPQDLSRHMEYGATELCLSVTYEDGISKSLSSYDTCNFLISKSEIARASFDASLSEITITPAELYGIDANGKQVMVRKLANGSTPSDLDPIELKIQDNRGLDSIIQDAQGNLKGQTYTATRQKAREFHYLSNPVALPSSQYQLVTNIDETRNTVDALDRTIRIQILRNNNVEEQTDYLLNSFDEIYAEDFDGKNTWPVYRSIDNAGQVWMTNETKGISTVHIADLNGRETIRIQCATSELQSAIAYSQLGAILSNPALIPNLELWTTERDAENHILAQTSPGFYQPAAISNIQLQVAVQTTLDSTVLTWPLPQETNTIANSIVLNPLNRSDIKFTKAITYNDTYCSVDVSDLPTDIYAYEIDFILRDTSKQVIYRTIGEVQFVTNTSTNSVNVVPAVLNNGIVQLSGNTTGVTQVDLQHNGITVVRLPVNADKKVDVSQQNSGAYTLIPYTSAAAGLSPTLPFIIHTQKPAQEPLAQQIECHAKMNMTGDSGTLQLTMTPAWKNAVRLTCVYTDDSGESQTYGPDEIKPNAKGGYDLSFNTDVKEITSISLDIQTNETGVEWISLYNNEIPNPLMEEVISHQDESAYGMIARPSRHNEAKSDSDDEYELVEDDIQDTVILDPVIANFNIHKILYVTPLKGLTTPPTYEYLDVSKDRMATWTNNITATSITSTGFTLDITILPPGNYPFRNVGEETTLFVLTVGDSVYASSEYIPISNLAPVKRLSTWDRWGNMLTATDSLGNRTDNSFNDTDHIIRTDLPTVSAVMPDRKPATTRPVQLHFYNIMDVPFAHTNPNGNTNAYVVNAAGENLVDIIGDGTAVLCHGYNQLTQEQYYWDSRKYLWSRSFDFNSQIVTQTAPDQTRRLFSYNEIKLRNGETDGRDYWTRYNHDSRSNISRRTPPEGVPVDMGYDRNHEMTALITPEGNMDWERDPWGNALVHHDMGTAVVSYVLDAKKQIVRQDATSGDRGSQLQLVRRIESLTYKDKYNVDHPYSAETFSTNEVRMSLQSLINTWQGGRLMSVQNNSAGTITNNNYDTEDRRIHVKICLQNGTVLRDLTSSIDSNGRDIQSYDSSMIQNTGYDLAGNRRYVSATLYDSVSGETVSNETWNEFDHAERLVFSQGPDGNQSYGFTDNLRVAEGAPNRVQKTLLYDINGRLWETSSTDGKFSRRAYDGANNTLEYHDNECDRYMTYYENGTLATEVEKQGSSEKSNTTFKCYTSNNIALYQFSYYNGDNTFFDELNTDYVRFEYPMVYHVRGRRHYDGRNQDAAPALRFYDPNANISGIYGSDYDPQQSPAGYQSLQSTFNITFDGMILDKLTFVRDGYRKITQATQTRNFFTVNSQVLSSYNVKLFGAHDVVPGEHLSYDMLHRHNTTLTGGAAYTFEPRYQRASGTHPDMLRAVRGASAEQRSIRILELNKRFRLTPIVRAVNQSYPPLTPDVYTVVKGDTFARIAEKTTGNSSDAVLIAAADGRLASAALVPGEIINLPQSISSQNKASDYTTYAEFMEIMRVSLQPHMITPIREQHENFFKQLVEVVGLVAIMMVAPHLAPIILGSASALAVGVTAAGLDAAFQGIEVATHIKEKFSATEVLEIGLMAGFSQAANLQISAAAKAGKPFSEMQKTLLMLKATAKEEITAQLTELAAGRRHGFDLRAVTTALATQAAGSLLQVNAPGDLTVAADTAAIDFPSIMRQVAQTGVTTVINSAITSAIYQREASMTGMLSSFLGSNIGQAIGNKISTELDKFSAPPQKVVSIQHVAKKSVPNKISSVKSTSGRTGASASSVTMDSDGLDESKFDISLDFNNRRKLAAARSYLGDLATNAHDDISSGPHDYLTDPDRVESISRSVFGSLNQNYSISYSNLFVGSNPTISNATINMKSYPTLVHSVKDELKEGWLESLLDRGINIAEIIAEEAGIEGAELIELVQYHRNTIFVDTHPEPVMKKINEVMFRNTMNRLETKAKILGTNVVRASKTAIAAEATALLLVTGKGAWAIYKAGPGHRLDQFIVEDAKFLGGYLGTELGLAMSAPVIEALGVGAMSVSGFGIAFVGALAVGSALQAYFGHQTMIHNGIMNGDIPTIFNTPSTPSPIPTPIQTANPASIYSLNQRSGITFFGRSPYNPTPNDYNDISRYRI